MPTYIYLCPVHKEFEYEHSIKEKLETCPKCEEEHLEPQTVNRLISSGGSFILLGGSWARDNYK